ncbi:hypothetical protein FBY41_0927 [Humibacillus xanthopallidus]|uniref:Uncharacterized protein n=1 Tax=Humibacillus xanthopallidus TaxID=412689 RepID=A0A543I1T8_9MICO|nr:hypothetical protein FBY41_0927 [Humibacillus xanthopallidus]
MSVRCWSCLRPRPGSVHRGLSRVQCARLHPALATLSLTLVYPRDLGLALIDEVVAPQHRGRVLKQSPGREALPSAPWGQWTLKCRVEAVSKRAAIGGVPIAAPSAPRHPAPVGAWCGVWGVASSGRAGPLCRGRTRSSRSHRGSATCRRRRSTSLLASRSCVPPRMRRGPLPRLNVRPDLGTRPEIVTARRRRPMCPPTPRGPGVASSDVPIGSDPAHSTAARGHGVPGSLVGVR